MILEFIGIANILFFAFVALELMAKEQGFSFKKNTLSSLSSFRSTGRIFDVCLFIFSVNQIIFAAFVSQVFRSQVSPLAIPLFVTGGTLLCLASIFPIHKFPNLHYYLATTCLMLVGLGVLLLSIGLLSINFAMALILLTITCLIPLLFLGRKSLPGGVWEIPLFFCIAAWNIILSIFLFSK